jgi:catalase-peroxidase
MSTAWKATSEDGDVFEERDRATGELKWADTRVDLIFGPNSQLRALAEVYACADSLILTILTIMLYNML